MSDNSKIQWTTHTWNPWQGCQKVSPGCKYCYMYRHFARWADEDTDAFDKASHPFRSSKATFNKPLSYTEPAMVFTCSLSDFFIEEADAWRPDAWDIIKRTPHLTYQVLTKRPERIAQCLPPDWGEGYDNLWLGVSIENQEWADKRLPVFLQVPAKIHFVSAEPLLGPIDFTNVTATPDQTPGKGRFDLVGQFNAFRNADFPVTIDWVIIGGESGNTTGLYRYRPCEVSWMESIVQQCKSAGVSVFVKQLGTDIAKRYRLKEPHGGDIDEWPEALSNLKVRQFPHAQL